MTPSSKESTAREPVSSVDRSKDLPTHKTLETEDLKEYAFGDYANAQDGVLIVHDFASGYTGLARAEASRQSRFALALAFSGGKLLRAVPVVLILSHLRRSERKHRRPLGIIGRGASRIARRK
jgi:hypothetical protein